MGTWPDVRHTRRHALLGEYINEDEWLEIIPHNNSLAYAVRRSDRADTRAMVCPSQWRMDGLGSRLRRSDHRRHKHNDNQSIVQKICVKNG